MAAKRERERAGSAVTACFQPWRKRQRGQSRHSGVGSVCSLEVLALQDAGAPSLVSVVMHGPLGGAFTAGYLGSSDPVVICSESAPHCGLVQADAGSLARLVQFDQEQRKLRMTGECAASLLFSAGCLFGTPYSRQGRVVEVAFADSKNFLRSSAPAAPLNRLRMQRLPLNSFQGGWWVVLSFMLFFECLLACSRFWTVEPGHRAIIYNRIYGVLDRVYTEGTHFCVPFIERPIIYDVRTKPRTLVSLSGSRGNAPSRPPLSCSPPLFLRSPVGACPRNVLVERRVLDTDNRRTRSAALLEHRSTSAPDEQQKQDSRSKVPVAFFFSSHAVSWMDHVFHHKRLHILLPFCVFRLSSPGLEVSQSLF